MFDHIGMPEAGTQVPAGGAKSGERLEEAVLREVAEETGLLTATVVRQIAVEDKPHPDTGQPRRTSFFFLQAPADTYDAWDHQVNSDGDDSKPHLACQFLPLPLEQPLADDQDAWLGSQRAHRAEGRHQAHTRLRRRSHRSTGHTNGSQARTFHAPEGIASPPGSAALAVPAAQVSAGASAINSSQNSGSRSDLARSNRITAQPRSQAVTGSPKRSPSNYPLKVYAERCRWLESTRRGGVHNRMRWA